MLIIELDFFSSLGRDRESERKKERELTLSAAAGAIPICIET